MKSDKSTAEPSWTDQENFRLIINNIGNYATFTVDSDGTVLTWNSGAQKHFGYQNGEVIGRHISVLFPKSDVKLGIPKQILESAEAGEHATKRTAHVRKDNTEFTAESSILPIRDRTDRIHGFTVIIRDLTSHDEAQGNIDHLGMHDPLTGLPNRVMMNSLLADALNDAKRSKELFAVVFIGIDSFRDINDTEGYDMGDQVLQEFARRLKEVIRPKDSVSRVGGDEFIVILRAIKDIDDAGKLAVKIHKALQPVFMVNSKRVHATASVGVSTFPKNGRDARKLIRAADTAMSRSKKEGGDRVTTHEDRRS